MSQKILLHSPTLDSVLMVEKTIKKNSQECGKYQLWKKLPKKMMYQTFQVILDYLQNSEKILIDKFGVVIWVYNPKRINRLMKKKLIVK
jgi:nucleoid DNA-binding protein